MNALTLTVAMRSICAHSAYSQLLSTSVLKRVNLVLCADVQAQESTDVLGAPLGGSASDAEGDESGQLDDCDTHRGSWQNW